MQLSVSTCLIAFFFFWHVRPPRPTCQNAVHWSQLSIQCNHPPAAHTQSSPAGTQKLPVQLAAGLSDPTSTITPPKPSRWTQEFPKDVFANGTTVVGLMNNNKKILSEEWGEPPGHVVQGQQSPPECEENKGNYSGHKQPSPWCCKIWVMLNVVHVWHIWQDCDFDFST